MKQLRTILALVLLAAVAVAPMQGKNKKKATTPKAGQTPVIYTGELGKKIYGYNGTTPLNIHIEGGRIVRIEALPNDETPQYFKRAAAKIFPQYEGKTVAEARQLRVDAVTGATYSSEAIIKNIQLGLEQAASNKGKGGKKKK